MRWVRGIAYVLAGLVGLVVAGLIGLYIWSGIRMNRPLDVEVAELNIEATDAQLERGEHVAAIRGCRDCHGANLTGGVVLDDPLAGRVAAPNLTPTDGSPVEDYTPEDWLRAIRHGVSPEGRRLVFMPSYEYIDLGLGDLKALIAYLERLEPIQDEAPSMRVGPILRLNYLTGVYPLVAADVIDHSKPLQEAPEPGPTEAYGEYLAAGCVGCHGPNFSGGPIPGVPPSWPPAANLTPHEQTGLGDWSHQQFIETLRTGKLPDGRQMNNRHMPWETTAAMTDMELRALWTYLISLPPRPEGNR
jgi:mono/diheme cytochrome c family protein